MRHFSRHEREKRLIWKSDPEDYNANFDWNKDTTQDDPNKLTVIHGDTGYDKETGIWKEQTGKEIHLNPDQIKELMRGRLEGIWMKGKEKQFMREAMSIWRVQKAKMQLSFPPKQNGENRGHYQLRWQIYNSQRIAQKNQILTTYVENKMKEVRDGGGFHNAMTEYFDYDDDAALNFELALNEVVDTVVEHPEFQRGVSSYKEVMEVAFSRFGEILQGDGGGLDTLMGNPRSIPDEFRNLWKRGPDGQFRLHVPGIYHDGKLVRDMSEGYQRFTGETERTYRYQNEVDALDPAAWRRADEAFNLKDRVKTYTITKQKPNGRKGDTYDETVSFSQYVAHNIGVREEVIDATQFLPLQQENRGIVGGEIDPETGETINEHRFGVVGFRLPTHMGNMQMHEVETANPDEFGQEGIVMLSEDSMPEARFFGEIDYQLDHVAEATLRNLAGDEVSMYRPFFSAGDFDMVEAFTNDFDALKYDDYRVTEALKKIDRIHDLMDAVEGMVPATAGDKLLWMRNKLSGDKFKTIPANERKMIATALADFHDIHGDNPETDREIKAYFTGLLEVDEATFAGGTGIAEDEAIWPHMLQILKTRL